MVWGIAAIISFQLVDTYYISLLGKAPLVAISFTFPITLGFFSIIMGFGIAMSSVLSRLLGEGREADVRRVTTHGLILVFGVACVLAAIGYFFRDPLFKAMGADETLRPLIHEYMSIWFLGAAFMATPYVGNAAIRASGSTVIPALILVGAALLNAVLAPLLIFGMAGLPRLEMQGAALATLISNVLAMAIGLYILAVRQRMLLSLKDLNFRGFGDSARRLLLIAIPAGLTTAIQPLVNTMLVGILAVQGSEAVAAFGIATRIEAFAFIILMALSVGMAPIIGQNFGAKKFDRVNETLKNAILFCIVWSIFVAAILWGFRHDIPTIFSTDTKVIGYMGFYLMLVPVSYIFGNLITGWASAFNAIGKPHFSFAMIVIKMLLLTIPAAYLGNHFFGVWGVFAAISLVNIISGLGFHFMARIYLQRLILQRT